MHRSFQKLSNFIVIFFYAAKLGRNTLKIILLHYKSENIVFSSPFIQHHSHNFCPYRKSHIKLFLKSFFIIWKSIKYIDSLLVYKSQYIIVDGIGKILKNLSGAQFAF